MAEWSGNLLYTSFFLYLIATFLFGGSIKVKKVGEEKKQSKWATIWDCYYNHGVCDSNRLLYYKVDCSWTCAC